MKKVVFLLFALALSLRIYSFYSSNIVIGYDQVRDLFTARSIVNERDLKIIGPTAGNNTDLHHGVAFWYYLVPPVVLGGGNPVWVSVWGSIFNTLSVVVIYFFAKSLFKDNTAAFVSAFIAAVSNYFISFSGWIGNPSPTLLTVPLFFYFLWRFLQQDSRFLILATFFLGLSIQFELFFIYLIPVLFIIFLVFRPHNLRLRLVLYSLFSFLISVSSMLATEIKYGFSGVQSIFGALLGGSSQGAGVINNLKFMLDGYGEIFYAKFIAFVVILFVIFKIKEKAFKFLLIYLLSPLLMLLVGVHGAPWFLIGLAPAAAIAVGYLVSRLRNIFLIVIACVAIFLINSDNNANLLGADESSNLAYQLAAIDYTYQSSAGEPFVINSVTNPLYINYIWSYNYPWYGLKKYGYLPSWAGGDQLSPYDTLPEWNGNERYLFLLIDKTSRIPEVHKILAKNWADERSRLIEEKSFGGIQVEKREILR